MKISEHTLLADAFDSSYGFMLNRIDDALDAAGYPPLPITVRASEDLKDRVWMEFTTALEEMGVELQDVEVPMRVKE